MKPKLDKVKAESPLAIFLTNRINMSGKSQKEIADEAGYPNPNNITMIKQGLSKLAIPKAPALAKALGMDAGELVRMAITEYQPGVYEALAESEMLPRNDLESSLFKTIKNALDTCKGVRKATPNTALEKIIEEAIKQYYEPKI